jgi:hypothetical protein
LFIKFKANYISTTQFNMKKLYIIAILVATTGSSAFSQKLLKPKVDMIRGDTIQATSEESVYFSLKLTGSSQLKTAAVKTGKYYFLDFRIKNENGVGHSTHYAIIKGAKAYLKLDDNSLVTISALGSEASNGKADLAGNQDLSVVATSSDMTMRYILSEEDVAKLSAHGVKVIRLETTKEDFDYEIKDKNAMVIGKVLQLIKTGKTV